MSAITFLSYLSSAEVLFSSRRATISCWICCVPSKMSRIFESRAHFSSNEFSVAARSGELDAAQRDVHGRPSGLGLRHRGLQRVRLPVVGHPRRLEREQVGSLP